MNTPDPHGSVIVSLHGVYHLRRDDVTHLPRCAHYHASNLDEWEPNPLTWEQVLDKARFRGTTSSARRAGLIRVCSDCWMGRWEKPS